MWDPYVVAAVVLIAWYVILPGCAHTNWPVEPTENQQQWASPDIEQRLAEAFGNEKLGGGKNGAGK